MEFIAAQVIGVLAVVTTIASTQCKSKDGTLAFIGIMDILIILQYALLGAVTGLIVTAVGTIRVLIFYLYDKEGKKIPWWILAAVSAVICGTVFLTYKKPIDLLPVLGTLIFTFGMWQNNVKILRATQLAASAAMLAYNIDVLAYADAVRAGLEAIFVFVGYVRYEIMGRHK